MVGMYGRLLEVLDQEDEPRLAARSALAALREPTPEVLSAGIAADQWIAAIEAMRSAAEADEIGEQLAIAAQRKRQWPQVQRQLEALGCQVTPTDVDGDRWEVTGPSVNVEVDLHTGELCGLDGHVIGTDPTILAGGFYRVEWTFDDVVHAVEGQIRTLRVNRDKRARHAEMRKAHVWVQGEGWIKKGTFLANNLGQND